MCWWRKTFSLRALVRQGVKGGACRLPAAPAPKSPACSQPMRSVNELWQGLSGAVVVRCLRSCTWCRRTPCTAQSHPSVKGVSVLQVVAVLILSAETILCVHVHALLCACAAPPAACVRCWLDPMAPIFLLGCRAVCVCVCLAVCVLEAFAWVVRCSLLWAPRSSCPHWALGRCKGTPSCSVVASKQRSV